MTDTVTEIDRDLVASDFRELFKEQLPPEAIENVAAHLASAPKADLAAAATTAYPANGSIASLILYTKCQCVIKNGGKTFDGSTWGVAFPGGAALLGDVYTDDINKMYSKTSSFALAATPVYTSFIFMDDSGNALGSFQAGSISTVIGTGGGSGHWS